MAVRAEIKDVVSNISKNVVFLQPLYEAIINSLEAKATRITIVLYSETGTTQYGRINGFDITDNGEGFTEKNIQGFNTLWTNNKREMGCKGSGRFTWLSVFEKIGVTSCISSEKKRITFDFNYDYDFENSNVVEEEFEANENNTTISFRNVTNDFRTKITKKGTIDKRDFADPNDIKNKIIDYLLVKLFLLKKKGVHFEIIIKSNEESAKISDQEIPDLGEKVFNVTSELTGDTYEFKAYYLFTSDKKNSKIMYFCSNDRATKPFESGQLGFSAPLPYNDSFIMLVCSDYFENKDNDSRNNFDQLSNLKNQTLLYPLLITDIFAMAKRAMKEIIEEHYPSLKDDNKKAEEEAIESHPYLIDFIKEDNEITKTPKSLITNATKLFNKRKENVRDEFKRALERRSVDSKGFEKATKDLSIMAAIELSEYIHYRECIIKAMIANLEDEKYKEDFYHNIVIPMGTEGREIDGNKHLYSNLWLLDDKFMTYSYVWSNLSIGRVSEELDSNKDHVSILNRPDTTIIFNRKEGKRDAVVVEFKGSTASDEEKRKSITELPDDIALLRENVNDIQMIWGYIVTTIDDQIEKTLTNQDYKPLFVSGDSDRLFYKYYSTINAHIYVCDFKAIAKDAEARNRTFLDILKDRH